MNFFNKRREDTANLSGMTAEHSECLSKYNTARSYLRSVVAFTAINIILSAIGTNYYILFSFSAQIPYMFAITGYVYAEEYGSAYLITGVVLALIIWLPYLVCWIFSKKHYGWMIAALVYFSIDCIFLLLNFDMAFILGVFFHAIVMYCLITGIKSGKELKTIHNVVPDKFDIQRNNLFDSNDDDNLFDK